MKRWLVLLLALLLAAIAGYALLTDSPPSTGEPPFVAHGETDRETEKALDDILQRAEQEP